MIYIEDNVITANGFAIGEIREEENRIVLNLGWMRLAKVKLTIEGDPKTDRKRIVLARPADPKVLGVGTQESLPMNGDGPTTAADALLAEVGR